MFFSIKFSVVDPDPVSLGHPDPVKKIGSGSLVNKQTPVNLLFLNNSII